MKILYCSRTQYKDLDKMIKHQMSKFFDEQDLVCVDIDDFDGKTPLLEAIDSIEDDYIVVVPPTCILLEKPDMKYLESLASYMESEIIEYVRLARVGIKGRATQQDEGLSIWKDTGNIFAMVPHVIRRKTFKKICERVNTKQGFFWASMETTGFKGCYYFNKNDQEKDRTYFVSKVFNFIPDVMTTFDQWNEMYVNHNGEPLVSLANECSINLDDMTVGSIGGCCR